MVFCSCNAPRVDPDDGVDDGPLAEAVDNERPDANSGLLLDKIAGQSPIGKVSETSTDSPKETSVALESRAPSTVEGSPCPGYEHVLDEAKKLAETGWLFAAEEKIKELIDRLRDEDREELIAQVQASDIYGSVVASMRDINGILQALLDDEGWHLQKSHDKISVWTRPESGSNVVSVRIAGLVDGPFEHLSAISKETGLIKTWMPGVKVSHVLKQLNEFDHVGYYCWKYPFVSAREFVIEEHNVVHDREGYCLVIRQPPIPRDGLELPVRDKHTIRADITNWFSFSYPMGGNTTFVITVMNVDLKIPLPTWLVNHLSSSMGYQSFQQMRQNVQRSLESTNPLYKSVMDPQNATYYGRMRALQSVREAHPSPCQAELLETGWIDDPAERRKLFARCKNVLVPMS